MLQISLFFWQMCLFRRSPADFPSSNFATLFVFSVYLAIAISVILFTRSFHGFTRNLLALAIGIALQASVTYGLLRFKKSAHRFQSTWSALLGTNAVILLILLPISTFTLYVENKTLASLAEFAAWACLGWGLAIAGYIYHKASEISVIQGSAVAFAIELLGVAIAASLIPPSP